MLLYKLSEIEMQILEQLESEDGIDKEIYDTLKFTEEEILVSCARVYRQILSDAQACKDEEKRLSERKKRLENNAARLKELMFEGMKMTDVQKIHRPEFDIAIRKNPPSLQIADEAQIPMEYYKPQAPILDKAMLKDDIKNGLKIDGISLIQTERVDIK